jgi:hypothetical protein
VPYACVAEKHHSGTFFARRNFAGIAHGSGEAFGLADGILPDIIRENAINA